jgi:hypothetical protein
MSISTDLTTYEAEWLVLAEKLKRDGNATLDCGSKRVAERYRFRFYGFRRALKRHDPTNPYLGILMESQATINDKGELHFERSPFAPLLRGLLENSVIEPVLQTTDSTEVGSHQEQTLMSILNKGDKK